MRKENRPYTPDEVAELLKISKHTVYELIKRGELAAFRVGNKMRIEPQDLEAYKRQTKVSALSSSTSYSTIESRNAIVPGYPSPALRLAGSHDFLIEHMTRFMNSTTPSLLLHSSYIGSLEGLMMLYRGATDIAAIHLIDPATKEYNLPFIHRLFIHEPITVMRLAARTQGFIVAKNNPKNISTWEDLQREDVTFVNRQKGSGTRFLLDAHLAERKIHPQSIKGYEHEEWSHFDTAARVARGSADVALGIEAAARKLDLSFIPVATEYFDLVIRWTDENKASLTRFCQMVRSAAFKTSLKQLEGYDDEELGNIIYETKNILN
ncbi:DNA binding domain protein, excisionase family [Caldalkalibacillus thermarum TA2.A1]|uniref:DNA binding domain protein, excisionase family n=1 Tax=Caldalkalibacillus thermarum (strain TA2.A1) TaxID=986075 RepID=F5L3D2_CALTT|nr:helix-turn-helix transcriptional regulator [Caldalkalibacillus thermarum]EGL84147.1 DNA binding domain protein, excisionase family [Caldalkalibacillus thermarum TA2.A1]QZT33611.1 helix-turn-helix transcriptional regulator [Caldalkalibacillus thermarum TA2.A1]